jgi:hypothetical protein
MAFELIVKGYNRGSLPGDIVSITGTTISFGRNFNELFKNKEFCEVYLDREENLIGFKPSKDKIKGFSIYFEGDKLRMSCKFIGKNVSKGRYHAKVDNGMIVIKVPEIAEESENE